MDIILTLRTFVRDWAGFYTEICSVKGIPRHNKKQCQRQELCKVNFAPSSDSSIHEFFLCKIVLTEFKLFTWSGPFRKGT